MINKTIIQGRLTADPELQTTTSGVNYINFTVAWSEKYKEIETKCFLRCKAWRGTAEFISNYFKKGQEIVVEGKLITEEWEKDGEKRSMNVLSVDKVHFCGKKTDSDGQASDSASVNTTIGQDDFIPVDDNSLPF